MAVLGALVMTDSLRLLFEGEESEDLGAGREKR